MSFYNMVQSEKPATLLEIWEAISTAFTHNQNEQFQITDPRHGDFTVHIEQYADFSVMNNIYQPRQETLHIPIRPQVPSLLMSFCLSGKPGLSGDRWEASYEANQALFNVFPARNSTYVLPANTQHEDLVIKLEMHTPFLEEFTSDSDDQLSNLLYKATIHEESLHSLQGNLTIDQTASEILAGIQKCPYTGKLREVYMESQVKLLLVHQLSVVHRLQHSNKPDTTAKLTKADQEKLQELKLYLESHFLEDHSLQSLTKQFGLNLFKLKYGFKTLFNTSVMKFIDDKKLQYAHLLLQQENVTVFQVADTLHYGHYNNFSAAYKRKFGYSPQLLRKG
ncbi:helix-turn-helix transcriptional regulator [Rhodocytophaga rosea]|uniref:Helix-turn-helix transcriptional regulator n=1 Tax=Rhodocytophaga rosea TaxID=2704465 RepID=A0A6C0GKH2_9BACT|nr:AraC family transcriptional regulator [Rhodocytophaga rosea]QHT68447.1 helix-turn-helix transcriptional regulator [Rhodocytophaga rosea]